MIELQRNECGFTISKVDIKPLNTPRRISRKPTLTRPLSAYLDEEDTSEDYDMTRKTSDLVLFVDRESH